MVWTISCSFFVHAQNFQSVGEGLPQEFQDYVISQYGMEEGLPQSTVNDIIQTKDGYIWLATFGGLVRFDGNSFTTYNRSNTKGLRSDRVLHLFEDSSGAIWLATEDGFHKFEDGEISVFIIEDDSFVYSPHMVKEDAHGTIWFVGAWTSFKIEGDSVVEVPAVQDSVLAQKALQDSSGVWLAHEFEVLRTYKDTVVQMADLSSIINEHIVDFVELPQGSGEFFLGTAGDGVYHYKKGDFKKYTADDGLSSGIIRNFYIDSKQNLWVSGYLGISLWNGSGFTPFDLREVIDGVQLGRVLEDTDGNLWIGSVGEGLFKLRPSNIKTIGLNEGLKNEQMLSLTTLKDGAYLFATNCGGVYEYNPESGNALKPAISDQLPNQCIWSVFQDSKERIWFGSRILYRSESLSKPGITIDKTHGFTGIDIFTISEDSKGNIWIGALNGLFKYDGETYFRYSTENGLSYNDTRTVFEDKDGVIWVGTSSGLNKIEDGIAKKVPLELSQPGLNMEDKPYVRAIHQDDEGVMWIGTYGNGIFRMEDGKVTSIREEHGIFDNIVSHIVEDHNGNFWMGSNRGIFRVHKNELNAFAADNNSEISGFIYGMSDGMSSAETNGGFEPNVIQSEDGDLYFPTVSGVVVVSTDNLQAERKPPPVYIEKISNGENNLSDQKMINLNHDNAFIEINYTALNFRDPDKLNFRYKMEGLNDHWFEVGKNRSALFTKIPPGEYTFKVTANSNNGPWNPDVAEVGVIVTPPFWQTSWFLGLMALVFISSGPAIYHYKVNKIKEKAERQKRFTDQLIESQENERRRIASELHDDLGQQILVIKNRTELARMQLDNRNQLSEQLDDIMQSATHSIQSVRNISHGLRPVHLEKFGITEALDHLCQQLQQSSAIDWSYYIDDIDGIIEKDKEINFYRVIQEATNNIIRHSEAKEASVMVSQKDGKLRTAIWDDGKGFEVQQLAHSTGLGFLGMKERIENLNGTLQINSKPGEGASLTIEIPINSGEEKA